MKNWEFEHVRFLMVMFFFDDIIMSKLNSTVLAYKRQGNQTSTYQYLLDHRESKGIKEKKIYFCFIDHAKPFVSVDHHSCVKYLNKCEYEITLPVSWEICIKVKNEQLDLDMEQLTGSKLGKELTKMYIFIIQNARLDE